MENENPRRKEATVYANSGLNGDFGDHESRIRDIAYAQVQATIYLGDQLERIAEELKKGARIVSGQHTFP